MRARLQPALAFSRAPARLTLRRCAALTEKSYLLRDQSQRFHRSASDVKSTIRKRSWATIAKMVACLLLLLAIIGLIIYLSLYFASNR